VPLEKGTHKLVVVILVLVGVGALVWSGVTLLIDAWPRHRRADLTARLAPFQPTVADEAEVWLRKH
jgi:hypothetical protein